METATEVVESVEGEVDVERDALERAMEAYERHLDERLARGELAAGSHYTYKWGAKRFVSWVKNGGERRDGRKG